MFPSDAQPCESFHWPPLAESLLSQEDDTCTILGQTQSKPKNSRPPAGLGSMLGRKPEMPAPSRVDLSTPTARKRLQARAKPYWHPIAEGRALGYRRVEGPGLWRCRSYRGAGEYADQDLGLADDTLPADGKDILSFAQALKLAMSWYDFPAAPVPSPVEVIPESYTVAQAMEDYLQWYRAHRKSILDVEQRIRTSILPALGHLEVAQLSVRHIRLWHQTLGTSPGRLRGGQLRPILTADD